MVNYEELLHPLSAHDVYEPHHEETCLAYAKTAENSCTVTVQLDGDSDYVFTT